MVDTVAGQILATLKRLGLDENAIVVWTTDHKDAIACHSGYFDKARRSAPMLETYSHGYGTHIVKSSCKCMDICAMSKKIRRPDPAGWSCKTINYCLV